MNRKKFLNLIYIFLIFYSIFSIFLFLDNDLNNNKLFYNLSEYYKSGFYNLLGNFIYFYFTVFLFIQLLLISPFERSNKFFTSTGLILIALFISPFIESYNIKNIYSGVYGISLSKYFSSLGFLYSSFIYFLWLLTSLFFLLFPAKNFIGKFFISLTNFDPDKNHTGYNKKNSNKKIVYDVKNKHEKNNKLNKKIPLMSKIIYEHNNNRTEIPVIPRDNAKIRQFQLINEDESKEEYQEIKLINNQNEILNDRNNEIYFKTLKEEWPKTWKSSENNNIINDAGNEQFFDDLDETDFESFNQLNKKKNNFNNYQNEDLSQFQDYELPESDILENYNNLDKNSFIAEHKESARTLEETLKEFDIDAKVTEIINGPVVTLYKLIPAPGIKLQKIESLSNNLALRLAAKSIRIIAPIPGEKVVGIEIPNRVRQLVKFKEIVKNEDFTETEFHIPIGLGKDIHGNIIVIDLYKMPHLLIAGATGSGKSVCVNSIIASILFSKSPDDIRLLLIDPKIVELKPYNNIPHLLTPVIYEPKKAIQALKYLMYEMDRRYILLDEVGARDIVEYQKRKIKSKNQNLEDLKFIVAVVDEFADLMNTSGKEAEIIFARLAAKARAVGIHLILATQRPSTDVITGLIKANIPARIAFQVISLMNSRIILDQKGAENLLGQGDMLYISPTQPFPIRIQGAFLSKEEVDLITDHWKSISTPNYINIDDFIKEENEDDDLYYNENDEPLFEEALKIIYQTHKASASYLQRRLSIGYNRAARIIEEMEKRGILGPQNGSKPREIMKSSPDMY